MVGKLFPLLDPEGAGARGVEAQERRGLADRLEHLRGLSIGHSPADRRMRTVREQAAAPLPLVRPMSKKSPAKPELDGAN